MKKNCICLRCKNLVEDLISKGKLKCLFQIETDETIEGELLNGDTDKCPYDFYESKGNEIYYLLNNVSVIPEYAGPIVEPIEPKPSYTCIDCTHYINRSCTAFPEGIPYGIIMELGHKEKLPGQNSDLVFEWNGDDFWARNERIFAMFPECFN